MHICPAASRPIDVAQIVQCKTWKLNYGIDEDVCEQGRRYHRVYGRVGDCSVAGELRLQHRLCDRRTTRPRRGESRREQSQEGERGECREEVEIGRNSGCPASQFVPHEYCRSRAPSPTSASRPTAPASSNSRWPNSDAWTFS